MVTSGSSAFAFDDVVVVRGKKIALDGFTAEIPGSGVTAAFGPSGAGKSTLLRLCNRLEVPTSGRAIYRGQDIQDIDPLKLRRQVGMVFQRPTPFPGTVRDNLLTADPEATDAELETALTRSALDMSWLDCDTTQMSGGEAQRVCMARTLITDPDVLLLDEPTSALDSESADVLETAILDLARNGTPSIWVSHDARQVERVADQVVCIIDGKYVGDRLPEGEPGGR